MKIVKSLTTLTAALCVALMPAAADAQSQALVSSSSGRSMFAVIFADENELNNIVDDELSNYTQSERQKQAVLDGLQYWADMFGGASQNIKPATVFVGTIDEDNAMAQTFNYEWFIDKNNVAETDRLLLNQALQQGTLLADIDPVTGAVRPSSLPLAFSVILVGKFLGADQSGAELGWDFDTETLLPTNEAAADLVGTVRHEMGHALGITSSVDINDAGFPFFYSVVDDPRSWDAHLIDQNGNAARRGMQVVTSAKFKSLQAQTPTLLETDFFIMDNLQDDDMDEVGLTTGKAYFCGEHVSEVLNGATFDGVNGLPVNGWEYNGTGYLPELSHIQTTGMMSHRSYSNYTSFMEAELAVMQDLGYQFDRKNYFGFSVYGDDQTIVNRQGYSARNADGTAYLPGVSNTTSLGVGLHLYGSRNNIIQAGDILTVGAGAAGIRIDGDKNTVTLASAAAIHADGRRGIGILTAYGHNHRIIQQGTVTALGEGGIGVRFDFGSSSNGAVDEYRGSYIRYLRDLDTAGNITDASNGDLTPELDGALVDRYDLAGHLAGGRQAIYIAKNAFVKDINILPGASIQGDILSDWKHFDGTDGIYDGDGIPRATLQLQYGGDLYNYNKYIPDLTTSLNFAADIDYAGNITGVDNMKLVVADKTLRYSGKADVVAVTVAAGAKLLGGSYKLNDMSGSIVDAYTDASTGWLTNHGTIGAATPATENTVMLIDGSLLSDGKIQFTANREAIGSINVSGALDISGSTLTLDRAGRYTPDKQYSADFVTTYRRAENAGFAAFEPYATGMLTANYNGSQITLQRADNLGEKTVSQRTVLTAVNEILDRHGELAGDYAGLYNLDAMEAKRTLGALYGGMHGDLADAVKSDDFMGKAVKQRAAGDTADGLWALSAKNWRRLDGANGRLKDNVWHLGIGRDRPVDEHWRLGGDAELWTT